MLLFVENTMKCAVSINYSDKKSVPTIKPILLVVPVCAWISSAKLVLKLNADNTTSDLNITLNALTR